MAALPLLRLPPSSHRLLRAHPSSVSAAPSSSSSRFPPSRLKETRLALLLRPNSSFSFLVRSIAEAAAADAEAVEEDSVESCEDQGRRLLAQNIPWTCTAEDIRSLFEKHGTVVDVELSMHSKNLNRGLAFVTMSSSEEALAALHKLNSYELGGRVIRVELARSSKRTPPAPTAPVQKYNIFVGNLAWGVRSSDLWEFFNGNGNVLSAEVIYQSKPRRPAGYGFVSFDSKEAAEAAITAMNGKILMGRHVRLVLGKVESGNAEGISNVDEQLVTKMA